MLRNGFPAPYSATNAKDMATAPKYATRNHDVSIAVKITREKGAANAQQNVQTAKKPIRQTTKNVQQGNKSCYASQPRKQIFINMAVERIWTTNIRGIVSKLDDLHYELQYHRPSLVVICETFLTPNVPDVPSLVIPFSEKIEVPLAAALSSTIRTLSKFTAQSSTKEKTMKPSGSN